VNRKQACLAEQAACHEKAEVDPDIAIDHAND
jgi:hypothetical protein